MKIPAEPTWIDSTSKLTGDKFKKIFIFFVINTPIPEKTARAIVLPTGVDVPIDYKMVDIADKMEGELRNKNLLSFPPTGDFEQRAVFTR